MALPQVGLDAVIQNLGNFEAGAKSIQKAYDDINAKAGGVEKATASMGKGFAGLGGIFGSVAGGLGNIATIAGGIVTANIFGRIADGVGAFASQSLAAVDNAQRLEVGLGALLTQSNLYDRVTEQVTTAQTKEIMSSAELVQRQAELGASINLQKASIQEQIERIRQTEAAWGAAGLETIQQKARLEQMRIALQGTEQDLAGLVGSTTEYTTATVTSYKQVTDFATAQKMAAEQSQELLKFVDKLSIVSPFEQEQVALITKYAIGAGLGVDETKRFTAGFLDLAAGVGIGSESLGFAADQLLQVAKVGKLTEIDLRQLRRLGINLDQIIGTQMGMTIDEFNAEAEKSPDIFNDLFASVSKFSETTFAGSVEKMALSVSGLRSTFSDLLTVGGRELFRPIVEAATPMISGLLGKLTDFFLGGKLANIGQRAGEMLTGGIATAMSIFAAAQQGGLAFFSKFLGAEGVTLWAELKTLIDNISTSFFGLSANLEGPLSGAFTNLIGSIIPAITEGLAFLNDHFEEFKGALIAIGGVLAGAAIAGGILAIGATIAGLVNPVGLVIAAAGLLGAAWAGNWGGIQEKVAMAWAFIQPVLAQLQTWLAVNVPIALQFLATAWTTVLQPALVAVWTFISGTLFPLWMQMQTWLAANIPAAIQTLADFWQTTLLPAIQAVISYAQNVAFPFWTALANLLSAVVGKAVTALAGLWQNILQPALASVWRVAQQQLMPVFNAVAAVIQNKLMPPTKTLSEKILPTLKTAFDGIIRAIKEATGWFNSLASAVSNFSLPPILTPGSPTPLEIALLGISSAAQQAGASLAQMGQSALSQAAFDKAFGIDRTVTSIKNLSALAIRETKKSYSSFITDSRAHLAQKLMLKVFRGNSQEILNATDRLDAFKKASREAGVDFAGILGSTFASTGERAMSAFLQAFDKHRAEAQAKLQKMLLDGAKKAIDVSSKMVDLAQEGVNRLQTEIDTLSSGLEQNLAQVELNGQVLDAADAHALLNQKLEEQRAIQQDINELQESEARLGFLRKQVELFETATKAGLNVKDIFGGMQFGLDASLPDLIQATNNIVQAMIGQINKDLQLASPSRVMFDKFRLAGMGMVEGLSSIRPLIEQAMGRNIASMVNVPMGQIVGGSSVSNTTNYNFDMNVNTGANPRAVMQQFQVARAMVS